MFLVLIKRIGKAATATTSDALLSPEEMLMSKLRLPKSYHWREPNKRYTPKKLRAEDITRIMNMPIDLSWYRNREKISQEEYDDAFVNPTKHWYPRKLMLARQSTTRELVRALPMAKTALHRAIICEILDWGRSPVAIPALLRCLNDRSPRVRSEAADAIGKIAMDLRPYFGAEAISNMGDPPVGAVVLQRFQREQQALKVETTWLPNALGAVGYRPAIPALTRALTSSFDMTRAGAAWSLGDLQSNESCDALRDALATETDSWTANIMRRAIERLDCTNTEPRE